jgi:hypothetical protein
MSTKDELLKARAAMTALLDEKLKNMPEWRAFSAIDRAITAFDGSTGARELGQRGGRQPAKDSYGNLGFSLLEATGSPLTTSEIVPAIASRRKVDPVAKRVVIQTALSKDSRIHSIPWRGGRAWWLKDKTPPNESAGNGAHP